MNDLAALREELQRDPDEPVTNATLLRAFRTVFQLADLVERHRATLVDTVQTVNQLETRLLLVDELPASAPYGALIRLRTGTLAERASLYLGNGQNQPLSRLTPTPL